MTILEQVWFLIAGLIIFIILSTDIQNLGRNGIFRNSLSTVFASASDNQKFILRFNWLLIALFFCTTLALNCVS